MNKRSRVLASTHHERKAHGSPNRGPELKNINSLHSAQTSGKAEPTLKMPKIIRHIQEQYPCPGMFYSCHEQ